MSRQRSGRELGSNIEPDIATHLQPINSKINSLTTLVNRLTLMQGKQVDYDHKLILLSWCLENSESLDLDLFEGTFKTVDCNYLNASYDPSWIYKNCKIFSNNTPWPCRIERKFYQKFSNLQEKARIHLLCYMQQILNGYFDSGQITLKVTYESTLDLQPYQAFFQADLQSKKTILFVCEVEKYPKIANSGKLLGFDFIHVIRFIDLCSAGDASGIKTVIKKYQSALLADPGRSDFGFIQNSNSNQTTYYAPSKVQQKIIPKALFSYEKNEQFQFGSMQQDFTTCIFEQKTVAQAAKLGIHTYVPSKFQTKYLSNSELSQLIFSKDIKRWLPIDLKAALERNQFSQFQSQINKELLNKYADFSSAAKLVELLQKIPNFKIKLTEEEKSVVGEPGNLLVIGRSGTGKTTCAILRLFAMEILFKLRVSLYKQKHQAVLQDTRFNPDDVDSQIGLHCIFATASPVLTTEVQRYYNKLTDQIKSELEKKQQKVRQEREEMNKQQEKKENLMQSTYEQIGGKMQQFEEEEEIPFEKQKNEDDFIKQQLQQIKLEEEQEGFEEDDMLIEEEDELIKQKMEKFVSLADLTDKEFPAFLTIRKLILMIDGAMIKPFFSRSVSQAIVGTEAKANWNNDGQAVLMIDNYRKKLALEDEDGKVLQNEEGFSDDEEDDDDNEENEDMDFENEADLEQEYQRQMYLQRIKQKMPNKDQKTKAQNHLAKEVDFDLFRDQFWPTLQQRFYQQKDNLTINPTMVWTEIYSFIKGSAQSHEFPGQYVPKRLYVSQKDQRMLSNDQLEKIYEIFINYEKWKYKQGHYDMMDVVNYLLTQFKYGRYSGAPIHYLMIDEVQDLPHATLVLLTKVTEQGLFFAGDTAQNIAKGVGFRFCDLKSLFQQRHFGQAAILPPVVKQLTVNFRSHNQILELANSLVSLMELFFPKTIDRLKKEKSNITGPKPIVLQGTDIDMLFFILSGQQKYKSQMHSQNQEGLAKRPPLEFGCNQVVLVKDQESKKKVPSMLQHALCLTILEAKGLEFDDVVLYNFFSDSAIQDHQWTLLNQLQPQEEWVDRALFYMNVTKHNEKEEQKVQKPVITFDDTSSGSDSESSEDEENPKEKKIEEELQNDAIKQKQSTYEKLIPKDEQEDKDGSINIFGLEEKDGKVLTQKLTLKPSFYGLNIMEFSQLCTELKQLYVAVTRPRNRLIIYDEDLSKREKLQRLWSSLNLVEVVSADEIQQILNQSMGEEGLKYKEVASATTKLEWKKQGLKMFRNKFYEQAMKCFQQADEPILDNRAMGYFLAEQAAKEQAEVESEKTVIENLQQIITKDKKAMINQVRKREDAIRNKFMRAGECFKQDGKLKQTAQCLYSATNYKQALEIYESLGLWKQAGEAAFLCQLWEKAAEHFENASDFIRAIDCLERTSNWDKILQIIHKYKQQMNIQTREAYLKRFLPIALEELLHQIDMVPQLKEQKSNEQVEQKEEKKVALTNQQVIFEDEEEAIEDGSEEEYLEDEVEGELQQSIEEAQQQEISYASLTAEQIAKISFDESQPSILQKQQSENLSDNQQIISFSEGQSQVSGRKVEDGVISFSEGQSQQKHVGIQSFSHQSEQLSLTEFDHLSHVDLEDEFLKNDRKSLIESIQSGRQSESSQLSEFSAISYGNMAHNPKMQLVKTKGDIYIQDEVMQRIIRYISMFSDEFKYSLLNQRSKNLQLTQEKKDQEIEVKENNEFDYLMDFILDLDLVDLDFVYLILDTLEQYRQYKLCIFVCNRYKLSNKVGRYLVSIGSRYSPLALQPATIQPSLLSGNNPQRLLKIDQSRVANFAIHSVLENINPEYLKMRFPDEQETGSLGVSSFQQLIQLGYWKKCLYALDYENALSVSELFMDWSNWKYISLSKQLRKAASELRNCQDQDFKDVYEGKQRSISEKQKLCFDDKTIFESWYFKEPQTEEDCQFAIMTYDEYLFKLTIQLTSQRKVPAKVLLSNFYLEDAQRQQQWHLKELRLPQIFSYTEKIIQQVLKQQTFLENLDHNFEKNTQENFAKLIKEISEELFALMKKISFTPLDNLRLFELIYLHIFLLKTILHSSSDELLQLRQRLLLLPNDIFLDLFLGMKNILNQISSSKVSFLKPLVLRSCLSFYRIRTTYSKMLRPLLDSQFLVHRGSPLISDLLDLRNQNLAKLQQDKQKEELEKQQYEQMRQEQLPLSERDKQFEGNQPLSKNAKVEKIPQVIPLQEDLFFTDLDFNFVLAPYEQVLLLITKDLTNTVSNLIKTKIQHMLQDQDLDHSGLQQLLEEYSFVLTYLDLKANVGQIRETFQKRKQTKEEIILEQFKKDDPLRQFIEFDIQKKKELERQKYQTMLQNSDEDQLVEVNEAFICEQYKMNKKKKSYPGDIGIRKQINNHINSILLSSQFRSQGMLNPQVQNSLMVLGFRYLQKTEKSHNNKLHKYLIRGSLIMNYLGGLQHVLSKLRSLQRNQKQNLTPYRKFIEYLEVKNLNIIYDQSDLLFDYIAKKSSSLFSDEKLGYLENSIINNLIGLKTNKKSKDTTLLIPFCLLNTLPFLKLDQIQKANNQQPINYIYTAKICPLEDDSFLSETLYWLDNFLKNVSAMNAFITRIIVLLMTVIINVEIYSEDVTKYLKDIIYRISSYDRVYEVLQKQKQWVELSKATSSREIIKVKKELVEGDKFIIDIHKQNTTLQRISIQNTVESIDSVYQQSLTDWQKIEVKNAIYLQKVKIIKKFISEKHSQFQKLNKFQSCPISSLRLSLQLNPQQMLTSRVLLANNTNIQDLAKEMYLLRRVMTGTYFQTYVDNALDFHYINSMANRLFEKEDEYQQKVVKFIQSGISQKDIYREYVQFKNLVEEFTQTFENWSKTNSKFEMSYNRLLEKNRKIMALKWMSKQGGVQSKFQKLQKKRAGLKKQKALQEKKEILKARR